MLGMSNIKGESALPYFDYTVGDLIRGKFNIDVLENVGSGYAGQVLKCAITKLTSELDRNRGQETGRAPLQDANANTLIRCEERSAVACSNETSCGEFYANDDDDESYCDQCVLDPDVDFAENNGMIVAIKIMPKKKTRPEVVENEVQLLIKGGAPNVVRYFTSVECLDTYWIFTEFCSRGDLNQVLHNLDNKGVMAREYMRGVVSGLECLHQRCIAHSDIKMKNILITERNVAKIADFGFAKCYSSGDDLETECKGTQDYWAPEMRSPNPNFNPFKTDIYALGVTFVGVCVKRPIKRRYDDIFHVVSRFEDCHQNALFSGLLNGDPQLRLNLPQIKTNIWLTEMLNSPPDIELR